MDEMNQHKCKEIHNAVGLSYNFRIQVSLGRIAETADYTEGLVGEDTEEGKTGGLFGFARGARPQVFRAWP